MKFGWMSGKGLKFLFTEKNISYPWTDRLLFWRCLLKMFDDGPHFFQHIVRKWWENHKFFFWFVFLKLFLRTSGMQFWQSFKKYLGWRPGNVHLLSEKDTKFYFPENRIFFPDMFLGTCRMQFRQQLKKFRQQAEIVCSTSKNDRRSTLFLEVFFQNWSSGQVEWKHCGKPDENS